MKFFVDTANLQEVEEALKRGFVDGVTTNPSLLAKEPNTDFEAHIGKIVYLIKRYKDGAHLSVEVFSRDPDEIVKQAKRFKEVFKYNELSIKVQIGWDELKAIHLLANNGISVNCTACMSVTQAVMAARAGARYVSLFWGRIRDASQSVIELKLKKSENEAEKKLASDHLQFIREAMNKQSLDYYDVDPESVVSRTRILLNESGLKTEIIAGSIRTVIDVRDAGLAGAHIVTVPPKFFKDMISHFKTDEVVQQFLTDFENWLK